MAHSKQEKRESARPLTANSILTDMVARESAQRAASASEADPGAPGPITRVKFSDGREIQYGEPVLDLILDELRAIRSAIEQPRQTAERENAEFLAGLSTK